MKTLVRSWFSDRRKELVNKAPFLLRIIKFRTGKPITSGTVRISVLFLLFVTALISLSVMHSAGTCPGTTSAGLNPTAGINPNTLILPAFSENLLVKSSPFLITTYTDLFHAAYPGFRKGGITRVPNFATTPYMHTLNNKLTWQQTGGLTCRLYNLPLFILTSPDRT